MRGCVTAAMGGKLKSMPEDRSDGEGVAGRAWHKCRSVCVITARRKRRSVMDSSWKYTQEMRQV